MLVTLLHDVGKILLRAGEEPSCELGQEFYKHDRLTCDFIMEYLVGNTWSSSRRASGR